MYKKEKERIRAERSHHPWASRWGLVVLFLMFVGQSGGCRLIPGGGGSGGNPEEALEKNAQTTPPVGFVFSQAQVGTPRYLPWGRGFRLMVECCDQEHLTPFWDVTAACYTSAVESIKAHYGPSAGERREATPGCPGPAWHGGYHSWAGWSEGEGTGPAWPGGLCLLLPPQHQLWLWGWAHPLLLGSFPRVSEPSAFQPLLHSPCGYISSPAVIKQWYPHYLISCCHHSPNSSWQAYLGKCGLGGWLQVDACFFAVCSGGQKALLRF